MKGTILVLALLGIVLCPSGGQAAKTYQFADISWGEPFPSATGKLRSAGWKPRAAIADSALQDYHVQTFQKRLRGGPCTMSLVAPSEGNARVFKVLLSWPVDESNFRIRYFDVLMMLTEEYGRPREEYERYQDPYYRGDGKEYEALSRGKGILGCRWRRDTEGSRLGMRISPPRLDVSYFCKQWSDLMLRLGQKDAPDF